MTYHDSLLNRVERLARQMGRTDEIVARLQQQEYDLRHARDAAVRELQQLRSERDTLAAEVATLRQERDQLRTDQQVLSHTTERLREFADAVYDAKQNYTTLNCEVAAASIEAALQRLETGEPVPPGLTKVKYKMCGDKIWDVQITAVTEPLDDSTGADGPGQS